MRKSLRTRLTVYFIALVLVPLLIVGAIGTWQTYTTQVSQALDTQSQIAKRVSEEVRNFIQLREKELNALTGVRGLSALSLEDQNILLASLFAQQNEYEELILTNPSGRELVYLSRTSLVTVLGNRAGASEFEEPKAGGKTYYGNVAFDESTGEPSMMISIPLINLQTGSVSNVLIAKVRFKAVWDIMADADVIGGGVVYMTDSDNFVVAHANPSVVLQRTKVNLPAQNSFTRGVDGENAAMAVEKIAFNEKVFYVVAEQPAAEALSLAINNIVLTLGSTLIAIVAAGFLGVLAARQITNPIGALVQTAGSISEGDLTQTAKVTTEDEIGALAGAFNKMTHQLRDLIVSLEGRVAERTRNLELASEVGRSVSQVRALDVMLKDATELIRSRFNLYYVQVYLADLNQRYLILQSGTGDVGEQLIERRHRMPLDSTSINGRAAIEKKSVVISDTAASPAFKPNPLLPNTRSELAVPLLIGDRVVGVLDVQSKMAGALSKDVLPAFEALAGQLAIAIQNANYLAETEQARAEVEAQARRSARANWANYLDAVHKPEELGFIFEKNKVAPLTAEEKAEDALAAPISIAGERLGELVVEMDESPRNSQMEQLIFAVARQVAQQVESLRLLENSERYRAEAEQASRRLTHEGWEQYLEANPDKAQGYMYDLKEVRPYRPDEKPVDQEFAFNLPLKVREETIGKLAVEGIENEEAMELVNTVAERLSAHIEGLRLSMQTEQALAATQKLAQREQALRQITSAVRGSTDPATILRTAARELGNILGRQTIVHLETRQDETVSPAESSSTDGGAK